MTEPAGPTSRVRVTASRHGAAPALRRTRRAALVEQTQVGELYLHGLLRAQLRLGLSVLAACAAVLLLLSALLVLLPVSRTLSVGPVPVAWLVLGGLLYPAMVLVAWLYVRRTEKLERSFTDVVGRDR